MSWQLYSMFLVYLAFNVASENCPKQKEIPWRYDYNQARKEAQEKHRPLLLYVTTSSWPCFYSIQIEKKTLSDPKICGLLVAKFVCLRVDSAKESSLVSHLRIRAYPTVILADPNGKILSTLEGYKEAPYFLEKLQEAVAAAAKP